MVSGTGEDPVLKEYLEKAESFSKEKRFQETREYYEKAIKRCDELLESNPRDSYLHYMKARVFYELRRLEGPDSLYIKGARKHSWRMPYLYSNLLEL